MPRHNILRSARRIAVWLSDFYPKRRRNRASHCNTVLVIFTARIGDFFAWLEVAAAIRHHHSTRRIILIANATWQSLAEALPFWDEVWPLDRARFGDEFGYRRQFAKRIAQAGASACIVFEREFRINDAIARLSGAGIIAGPDGSERLRGRTWELRLSDRWFTTITRLPPRRCVSAFESQLLLCKAFGIEPPFSGLNALDLLPKATYPCELPERYAVVAIGASFIGRRWPIARFVQIVDRLWCDHGLPSIICGDASDVESADFLRRSVNPQAVVDLSNQTSLTQLVALVSDAALVIGNESACVHIAALTKTPCVVMAGGGDFGRLIPYDTSRLSAPHITVNTPMPCYGCNWRCRYEREESGAVRCVDAIDVPLVLHAIESCLNPALALTAR